MVLVVHISYETNIENFLLAAAYDTHVVGRLQDDIDTRNNYYIDTVGVKDKRSYFQCGVSIYNIEEFKKLFRKGALIEKEPMYKTYSLLKNFQH